MKDRHATTRQWVSVPGVDPEAAQGWRRRRAAGAGGRPARQQAAAGAPDGQPLRDGAGATSAPPRRRPSRAPAGAGAGGAAQPVRRAAVRGVGGQRSAGRWPSCAGELRERDHRRRQLPAVGAAVGGVQPGARAAPAERGGLLGAPGRRAAEAGVGRAVRLRGPGRRRSRGWTPGELVPTGPLPGNREMEPPEGTAARALEDEALAAMGVTRDGAGAAGAGPAGRPPPGGGGRGPR